MLAHWDIQIDNLFMPKQNRSFEQIRQRIVESVDPSDVVLVRSAITDELQKKRDIATAASLEISSGLREREFGSTLSSERVQPRFGEVVLPLFQEDVVNHFLELGYSDDHAQVLWETLVYPERDVTDHYGPKRYQHPPFVQFRDIYPVHLLEHTRALDKHGHMHGYIQPESAVIDLVSLKSYLAWLNDREPGYDEMLSQHFGAEDRAFWSDFVHTMEKKLGEELLINSEFFAYYDSASDFFVWRECGRLAVANMTRQIAEKVRTTRVNAPEWTSLEYLAPVVKTQICESVWYVPDYDELEHDLASGNYVNIAVFHSCAEELGCDKGQGTYVFSHTARLLADESRDFFKAHIYLERCVLDLFNPGWDRNKLVIETAEFMRIYEDMENGIKIPGFGRKAKDILRKMLSSTGWLEFGQQKVRYVSANRDPADDAEINYNDPDLN